LSIIRFRRCPLLYSRGMDTAGGGERSDELYLPGSRTWDFPLSRSEKLQRLLQLFETDIDHFASEADALREENAALRAQLASASSESAAHRRVVEGLCDPNGNPIVEADIGSGVVRGSPQLVAEVLNALGRTTGSSRATPRAKALRPPALSEAVLSGDSSPSSSQDSSPADSPAFASRLSLHDEEPASGRMKRPQLPGLGLERLSCQVQATPRSKSAADGAVNSTPRCFSIRTPPGATPRLLSITTPRSRPGIMDLTPGSSKPMATPRSLSRVCSLVTPRTGFGTPRATDFSHSRSVAFGPLQQLQEDRRADGRHESGVSKASCSTDEADQDDHKEVAIHQEHIPDDTVSRDLEEDDKAAKEENSSIEVGLHNDDESNDGEATPEWMSFAGAPEAEVDLLSNFDALWCENAQTSIGDVRTGIDVQQRIENPANMQEPPIKSLDDLTSEAVWRLVEDRFQVELTRAVREAENRGRRQAQTRRLPRRPRKGERAELVADLMREASQTASTKAELLKPAALRLGRGVAKAGLAMQDAGRLVRETSAVVNFAGGIQPPPPMSPEVEASRRAKVAHAANMISSGFRGLTSRMRRQ